MSGIDNRYYQTLVYRWFENLLLVLVLWFETGWAQCDGLNIIRTLKTFGQFEPSFSPKKNKLEASCFFISFLDFIFVNLSTFNPSGLDLFEGVS